MLNLFGCTSIRLSLKLILIVSLISLAMPIARADDKSKEITPVSQKTNDAQPAPVADSASAVESNSPAIAYVLFSQATKPQPELAKPADAPELQAVLSLKPFKTPAATTGSANIPLPRVNFAASTAPMTSGEKFKLWAKRFVSVGSYATAAFSGLYNEALDNDEGKKDTVENYFADAATRAARSYAFGTTSGFFEKFAYASLFRQDPRYHRSDKRGMGGKIGYAVSRVFITQGDRCGCDQFNISFLAGGLTAAGIANVWEREERQTVGKTLSRWGTHTALTALSNIIREFIGGQ
ncbi:MAG: hypothetical protein WBV94_30950 [Blastocatellia bacterium]